MSDFTSTSLVIVSIAGQFLKEGEDVRDINLKSKVFIYKINYNVQCIYNIRIFRMTYFTGVG